MKLTKLPLVALCSNWPPNGCIQSMLITNKIDVCDPHALCHSFPSRPTLLRYVTLKKVTNSYDDMSYNWQTSTLYIFLNLCSPNPKIQLKYDKDVFKVDMNWNSIVSFFERCHTTVYFDPSPLCHTLSLFWSNSFSCKRVEYFLDGLLVFCLIILFDFLSFEVPTLREEIFTGNDFCKIYVSLRE